MTEQLIFFLVLNIVLIGLVRPVGADQNSSTHQPIVLAPFHSKSEFTASVAGSYSPPLGQAADGAVLDTQDSDPNWAHEENAHG